MSNLNLGFRAPSSRRTSEVNEPPPLIVQNDSTTRGSQHPGASKALVYAEQSLAKKSSHLKVETPGLRTSRVGDQGRQRESNKILQGEPSWNSRGRVLVETGAERRSEGRGGRRRACVEDPGQLQWPPGAETKVTEEL